VGHPHEIGNVTFECEVESNLVHERRRAVVVDVESLVIREFEWSVLARGADVLEEAGVLVDIEKSRVNSLSINPLVKCLGDADSSDKLGRIWNVCRKQQSEKIGQMKTF